MEATQHACPTLIDDFAADSLHALTRHLHVLQETKGMLDSSVRKDISRHNQFQHKVGLDIHGNREEQNTLRVHETTLHSQSGKTT